MKSEIVARKEVQIVQDLHNIVHEYVQLREMKKEIEERMKEIENILRPFTERNGNIVAYGYEVGWFTRRESEISDMKKFLEIAILKGVAEKVLKPVIMQVKSLKIKELLDLLTETERKIFSVKKIS